MLSFHCVPAASRSFTFLGKVRPREGRREEGMKEGREAGRERKDCPTLASRFPMDCARILIAFLIILLKGYIYLPSHFGVFGKSPR